MKTIEGLKQRRQILRQDIENYQNKKCISKDECLKMKKATKEIRLIDMCIRYLETNPNEGLLREQLNENKRKMQVIESRYRYWEPPKSVTFKTESARKTFFKKQMGAPTLMGYINTLSYLLRR